MNTYQALLATANLFERSPAAYDFQELNVPDCGSPGCAIGWTAFHMGRSGSNVHDISAEILGCPHSVFYDRMSDINLERPEHHPWTHHPWTRDAGAAAVCLRFYAEKYHGHEKPKPRPTSAMVADLMARVTGPRIPDNVTV